MRRHGFWMAHLFVAGLIAMVAAGASAQESSPVKLDPSSMPRRGSVDPRYFSYNIEMVEVTGGRFWKPYSSANANPEAPVQPAPGANQQPVLPENLFQYRPPIDLSNPRLRKLAEALGPAYMRVSGTWANSTYFQNDDHAPLQQPPAGYRSVLTRAEWKGVIDFSKAVGAPIVTSVAVSPGTRDSSGVWTPAQAQALFNYTRRAGGSIAAAEYFNEPNFATRGGAPAGYNAADFGRDAKLFGAFLRKESPKTIYLGPSGTGEGISLAPGRMRLQLIPTKDMMQAAGPIFDAFSYHFYGTVSHRCGGTMTADQALSAEWLDRTVTVEAFYARLRDQYLPGKPMWLTETGEAACGGDRFASEFADTIRFLNQLGTLAQRGVQVVMRNTLASSDYGLLDQHTFEPRPDYWAALLWKRTMGTVVLDPKGSGDPSLRIYAHCMKSLNGGVSVLALNTEREKIQAILLPAAADRFTLTAGDLRSPSVELNGKQLQVSSDGSLPAIDGERVPAGKVELPPASITFLNIPSAGNPSCR